MEDTIKKNQKTVHVARVTKPQKKIRKPLPSRLFLVRKPEDLRIFVDGHVPISPPPPQW